MQGSHSWAVFVGCEANEIKEARPFALSRGEGFWDCCLLRLLGGADIRERKVWEAKICPFLFLCYHTYAGITAMTMVTDIIYDLLISFPWSTLQNHEAKFLLDTFIWISHRNITLDTLKNTLTISLTLLLPLHFLYKRMTLQSTQSSQKDSFIHSLIDLKKYLFYSIPDNVCCCQYDR